MQTASTEKRLSPRIEALLPIYVEIQKNPSDSSSNFVGQITNICEGGLGVTLEEKLIIPSIVSLRTTSTPLHRSIQAKVLWSDSDSQIKNGRTHYGLQFLELEDIATFREFLHEVNMNQLEEFFGIAVPEDIKKNYKNSYTLEKFDQKQIMKVIDFSPPFLKIDKMVVLDFGKQNFPNTVSIGTGVLTINDTKGHYNDTIFLAQCGWLMASSSSVYLAILFRSTAPQVVEVGRIRLSNDGMLRQPTIHGSRFFIESRIVKKKLKMVVVNSRIFFEDIFVGEIDNLKLVLAPKDSIQEAKELPSWDERGIKKTAKEGNVEQIEDFFGLTMPRHIKKNYEGKQIYKKLNHKQIMEVIDFASPFLRIEKMIVFDDNKDSMLQNSGLGMGIVTSKDTSGHYNETLFLAMCGWLMSVAVSVHLAVLFPSTAPEVIEANVIRPVEKGLWKPGKKGTIFWVETSVIKKEPGLITVGTRISFDELLYGIVEESKSVLIQKELIWQKRRLG